MGELEGFDAYVRDAMASWSCPGTAIAVIKDGEPVYRAAFGVRDREHEAPMTEDTRFPMASVTKAFTAMSVALLVEDGLLEWDKPVREYMPELVLNDRYVTEHLTVRDMLSHRSGLPRHDAAAWRLDISRAELVRRMRHLKLAASFREHFLYNNLMYYITPYLVEKLSGRDWEEFVTERIFGPLGMSSSNFSPDWDGAELPLALGYRAERDEEGDVTGLVHVPFGRHTKLSPGGAGALFSTLSDMVRWLQLHANGGVIPGAPAEAPRPGRTGEATATPGPEAGSAGEGTSDSGSPPAGGNASRLLSEDNLRQMHAPHTIVPTGGIGEALHGTTISTYGLGWMVDPYRDDTLLHHGGGVEGHTLHVGVLPKHRVGVVVLTNLAFCPHPQALLYEAIDRALGSPSQDWNARYHSVVDPIFAGRAKSKQTTEEERVAGAPPTHPIEEYTGVFEADGYPEFAVRQAPATRPRDASAGSASSTGDSGDTRRSGAGGAGAGGGSIGSGDSGSGAAHGPDDADNAAETSSPRLQAQLVGSFDWSVLRHLHYDVFEWHIDDLELRPAARFLVNEQGEIDSVSLPIEPAVEDVVFKRKEVELTEEQRALVCGEYDPGIEGITFTISVHGQKVFFAQTGAPPQELKAHRVTDKAITFKLERSRIECIVEQGRVTKLALKAPETTLEAEPCRNHAPPHQEQR